jgi:hypothetical protein
MKLHWKDKEKVHKLLENNHIELKSRMEDCVKCVLRTQIQNLVHWWTSNSVAVDIQPLLTKCQFITSLNTYRKWILSQKLNYISPTCN